MEITRQNKGPRMSQIVQYGDTVYLAGQVSDKPEGDTGVQTRDVLSKIERLLQQAGSSKSKILATTIYLADMRDFAAMNEAWDSWVDPDNTPARATVEAKLARPQVCAVGVMTWSHGRRCGPLRPRWETLCKSLMYAPSPSPIGVRHPMPALLGCKWRATPCWWRSRPTLAWLA